MARTICQACKTKFNKASATPGDSCPVCRGVLLNNPDWFESIEDVTEAVRNGEMVYWSNFGYIVEYDAIRESFDVVYQPSGHRSGLFWADGKTTDYKVSDFFTA